MSKSINIAHVINIFLQVRPSSVNDNGTFNYLIPETVIGFCVAAGRTPGRGFGGKLDIAVKETSSENNYNFMTFINIL